MAASRFGITMPSKRTAGSLESACTQVSMANQSRCFLNSATHTASLASASSGSFNRFHSMPMWPKNAMAMRSSWLVARWVECAGLAPTCSPIIAGGTSSEV